MKRRAFMMLVGAAAAVSWPGAVSAQQTKRKRRVGVLMNLAADDKEGQARLIAIVQTLSDLGWKIQLLALASATTSGRRSLWLACPAAPLPGERGLAVARARPIGRWIRLPEMSNFCCLPGRAGGTPILV